MIHITYFFLLRPAQYTVKKSLPTPLQLKDVSLRYGAANFDIFQTLVAALTTSTYGEMEFTMQNNAVHGEVVAHGTFGDTLL